MPNLPHSELSILYWMSSRQGLPHFQICWHTKHSTWQRQIHLPFFFGEYSSKTRRKMPIYTQQICKQVTKDNEYLSLTPTPTGGKRCLKSLHSNHLHMPGAMSSQSWPVPALWCSESHWVISLENKMGRSILNRWQNTFLPDPKQREM